MSLVALLAVGAFGATQPALVTITSRGESLAQVLAQASEQSGIKTSPGDMGALPVIVNVEKMSGKVFLELLAEAVGGMWKKDGEGVILARDTSLAAEANARWERTRATNLVESMKQQVRSLDSQMKQLDKEELQKQIDRVEKQIKKIEERPGGNEQFIGFNTYALGSIFTREAMAKLHLRDVLNLKAGERVVYSTAPNARQKRLPYNTTAVNQFFDYRSRVTKAAAKFPKSPYYRINLGIQHPEVNEASELIVRITCHDSRGGYYGLETFLVGPRGEILNQGSSGFGHGAQGGAAQKIPRGTVVIRPESQQLARIISTGNRTGESQEYDVAYPSTSLRFAKADEKSVPFLMDPVAHEPSSFAVTDALLSMGATLKKPVIAYVPDSGIIYATTQAAAARTSFENMFHAGPSNGYIVEERENLLMIRSDGSDVKFTNRKDFKRLLDSLKERGYLHLREIAEYGRRRGASTGNDVDFRYLNAISPTIAAQVSQSSQQARMVEDLFGKRIDDLPYGVTELASDKWSPQTVQQLERFSRNFYAYGGNSNQTEIQRVEPTENDYTPSGNVRLRLQVSKADIAYAIDTNGSGRFLHANTLGARQNPTYGNNGNVFVARSFVAYRPAELKQINLSLVSESNQQAPTGASERSRAVISSYQNSYGLAYASDVGKVGDKVTNLDSFSTDFRRQVESAAKSMGPLFSPDQRGWKPVIPPQP